MNMESRAAEAIHLVIKAISEARKNVEHYQVAVQRAVAALQAQFGVDEDDARGIVGAVTEAMLTTMYVLGGGEDETE